MSWIPLLNRYGAKLLAEGELDLKHISGSTGKAVTRRMARGMWEDMERLYGEGLVDREIDERLTLRPGATAAWRRQTGRPANGWPGRKKRKVC